MANGLEFSALRKPANVWGPLKLRVSPASMASLAYRLFRRMSAGACQSLMAAEKRRG